MAQAPGHPVTTLIEVHGGNFGNNAEASLGQLLVDAFGEGVIEALQEITAVKAEELVKEREKAEKAEKLAAEKAEKADKEAAEKLAKTYAALDKDKAAAHPHTTGGKG